MKTLLATLFALALIPSAQAQGAPKKTLILEADTYCPYNCTPGQQPEGLAVDIMRAVFEPKGYEVRYQIVPWARTLEHVKSGEADVALASPPEEAPKRGLVMGREPIGHSVDCLYVRADNPLKFNKRADDLNSLTRLGTVIDYTYYEWFGEWINRPENKDKVIISRDENPTLTNLRNLVAGRLDGVVETRGVFDYMIQENKLGDKVRIAGCQTVQPVFNLFSPARPDARKLAAQLDAGIVALRKSGELSRILARYGMQDAGGKRPKQ